MRRHRPWGVKGLAAALAGLLTAGCATTGPKTAAPEPTTLEVREFQTRTYETKDTKMVMKAVMNALQDDNFVVKQATLDLGLLTATREVDAESPSLPKKDKAWIAAGIGLLIVGIAALAWAVSRSDSSSPSYVGPSPAPAYGSHKEKRFEKTFVTECTANVTEFGDQTKVRISFERRIIDNRGAIMKAEPVRDADYYRGFFATMDKSIFLQKEKV